MKLIFYFGDTPPWPQKIAQLRRLYPEVEFIPVEESSTEDIKNAHAFVCSRIRSDHLELASDLRIVFVDFAGPNMLPLDVFRQRGIRISNAHGSARYVAERALALALSFYGKIIPYHGDLKTGKWHGIHGNNNLDDSWESIYGKFCAVLGTGEIGFWIAKFLKVFDCRVIGFKSRPVQGDIDPFDEITLNLDDAVKKSELIFVTLPHTPQTEKIISAEILASMRGKVLVNVGRGATVDEEGLYKALKAGILKGAALDTWYTYPEVGSQSLVHPSIYPFNELPNVILSPHVGGFTKQAIQRNADQVVENIVSYLDKGWAIFEIDLDRMY